MIKGKRIFRMIYTPVVTLLYCLLWIALEWTIFGEIKDNIVDNLMMLLFVPVIWMALGAVYDDLRSHHNTNKRDDMKP